MRRALLAMLHRPGLPLAFFLRPVVVALENRGLARRFETVVLTDEGVKQAQRMAAWLERHLPGTFVEIRNLPGEAGLTAYRALAEAAAEDRLGRTCPCRSWHRGQA